jgi:D-beta-D-heptose 7-phosphate kinase/D-beta-D-heptose 1-phosphate adenosyltransferase
MLSKARAAEILARFGRVNILVVGDLMLDRYVFGSVTRISPEAPVPVVHIVREESRPGGASNVALNIGALGAGSAVAGGIGTDAAGIELARTLRGAGIRMDGVVEDVDVQTTEKTRVVAERQQVVRVDREAPPSQFRRCMDAICERLPALVAAADAVIIEDYGKGIICQRVVDAVLSAARATGCPAGLDPKDTHHLSLPWLTLATPNYREACFAAGLPETPLEGDVAQSATLVEAGRILSARWGTEYLMITLGAHGMYLLPRGGEALVLPTVAREVFDVSGAGDTVIATAMTALAAGASFVEASVLANHAAGIVVGKLGTAVCSPAELLASFEEAE